MFEPHWRRCVIRNPKYLDVAALQNVADYFAIDLPGERQITRVVNAQHGKHIGVNKGLDAGVDRGNSEEVTEVYSTQPRPVRAMNDVLDVLERNDEIIDLTQDPDATIHRRALIRFDADLLLSPATELGGIMSTLLPSLIHHVQRGGSTDDLDTTQMGREFIGRSLGNSQPAAIPHVFSAAVPDFSQSSVVLITDPANLFGTTSIDDLEAEFEIFGSVDQLVFAGRSFSLEKYLLPGLNRTLRRAMGEKTVPGLLESFADLHGSKIDPAAINVAGPAIIVSPIAIF